MPYGGWRWGSGNLPTARQFTGQVADATSGLDYYNARYYDPALGQCSPRLFDVARPPRDNAEGMFVGQERRRGRDGGPQPERGGQRAK